MSTKQRNTTIEVLRIIAMVFIVFSHYSFHGGVDNIQLFDNNPINGYLLQIATLGNLGVDIFVLISGYFLVVSKFSISKLLKLLLQVWFYSVAFFVLFIAIGKGKFDFATAIKCFFPTLFREYWFVTCYITLFLLSPFINVMIDRISRKQYLMLIMVMLAMWVVLPTITNHSMYGAELSQFVMLYLIGGYLRIYPDCKINRCSIGVYNTIAGFALMLISTFLIDVVGGVYPSFNQYVLHFLTRTSAFVVMVAVGMLIIFLNMKSSNNTYINELSSCTLGIYLIHCNRFVKDVIWVKIFHTIEWANSPWLPLHMICAVIVTFFACSIIEIIRKRLIEALYMPTIDRLGIKIERFANDTIERIMK